MINDINIHAHYGIEWDDKRIEDDFQKIRDITEKYEINKAAITFLPNNWRLARKLSKVYDFVYPGIYIPVGMDYEKQLKNSNAEYIKLHHPFISPSSKLILNLVEEVIDHANKLDINKIQIHTESITPELLDLIEKKNDDFFVLVHGANVVNPSYETSQNIQVERIKEVENVLFETSPYCESFFIPDPDLRKGCETLAEEKIVFGSDFSLSNDESWYNACLERIEKTIGLNEKIMKKNAERFFDY